MNKHAKRPFVCLRSWPVLALAISTLAHALPQDGQIATGAGSITRETGKLTIQQNSPRLALDWRSFNIGPGESVSFHQPSPKAIALNRITGQDASQILGKLQANGQIFLSNPNGILFGPAAQVNVGGLVATTGQIAEADFNNGIYRFSSQGRQTSVINRGTLAADPQGYIAMLAPQVINEGIISARLGTALLAAGDQVTVKINDGSLLGYTVERGAVDALADNRNLVKADGGQVLMGAKALDSMARAVVNNDGVIEARTVQDMSGKIELMGDMEYGQVSVNGRLDASAPERGNGGKIETSAAHVNLGRAAVVTAAAPFGTAGSWLIDPQDYLLDFNALTQDGSGKSVITSLETTDVTISTSGPGTKAGVITVNGQLAWGNGRTLTLIADSDIVLTPNTVMSMSTFDLARQSFSFGNLVLKAGVGQSGKGSLIMQPGSYITRTTGIAQPNEFGNVTLYFVPASYAAPEVFDAGRINASTLTIWLWVHNAQQLQALNSSAVALASNFALARDVDASMTRSWNDGAGFVPVGTSAQPFTGTFDGQGHSIKGLFINRPGASDGVGLFGVTRGAAADASGVLPKRIANVGLIDASITGGSGPTGALAGENFSMHIDRAFVSGSASATYAGSIVNGAGAGGSFDSGRAYAATGGLVGSNSGLITFSYSDAAVNGQLYTGGLVGKNTSSIRDSYSTGAVSGFQFVGGLVGGNESTVAGIHSIDSAYSTSSVTGRVYTGGLIGENAGSLHDVYSTGLVRAFAAGGLIGIDNYGGWDNGSHGAVFWNTQSSGNSKAVGSGISPAIIKPVTNASITATLPDLGLDTSVWFTYPGHTAPLLKNLLTPVSVNIKFLPSMPYQGKEVDLSLAVRPAFDFLRDGVIVPGIAQSPNLYFAGQSSTPVKDVGDYSLTPSVWSDQKGYLISLPQAALTLPLKITPITLGLLPTPVQKEYDGTRTGGTDVKIFNLLAGHTVAATQSLDSADVNTLPNDLRTVSVDRGAKVMDGTTDVTKNYLIELGQPLTSPDTRIRPKPLTITANSETRQAGGAPYSGGNGFAASGYAGKEGNEVLFGQITYGGNSQGATAAGRYDIVPGGLSARNYTLSFVNGELVLRNPVSFGGLSARLAEAIEDGSSEMDRLDDTRVRFPGPDGASVLLFDGQPSHEIKKMPTITVPAEETELRSNLLLP